MQPQKDFEVLKWIQVQHCGAEEGKKDKNT